MLRKITRLFARSNYKNWNLKVLIQRVKKGSVFVQKKLISEIGSGIVIFVGIYYDDSEDDVAKLYKKILNLRIFNNASGKIHYNIIDTEGEILLISQFTLCANTEKGNRPSFKDAMNPADAEKLFMNLKQKLDNNIKTKIGQFGAMMEISLINSGPMTIMLDSKQ